MNFSKIGKLFLDFEPLKHVAIIMDGNGRWAQKRMFKRSKGHKEGVEVVKEILLCCCRLQIKNLTLYAFSTENWQRPEFEVQELMKILLNFLIKGKDFLFKNKISLNVIGELAVLPSKIKRALNLFSSNIINNSNKRMQLNLALSYGSRSEITAMVRRIASGVKFSSIQLDKIETELISRFLITKNILDPDILIRTGGEIRVSNFLLWQIAYTEFFFTNTLWPDFGEKEFIRIIRKYKKRSRKFGFILE